MEAIIGEVIIGVILIGIGWSIKNVGSKLDIVLNNQQLHEIEMAKLDKDVRSNTAWGQDSKGKIQDHEKRINSIEIDVSALNAKNN